MKTKMSRHSIKDLTATLDISRGRVYQIINSLTGDKEVKKDSNGNYILDDKAVRDIRSYFEEKTIKDENKSSNEQLVKLHEQVDTLKKKVVEYERQIDGLNKQVQLQNELIDSLKTNNHTLTQQLNIKDEQISKANELAEQAHKITDQAQKLNAVDKQKEIEHNNGKKSLSERFSDFFSGNSSDKNS